MAKKATKKITGNIPQITRRAMLASFDLIDCANGFGVPWRENAVKAIQATNESEFWYWMAAIETDIHKEIDRIDGVIDGGTDAE